MSARLVAKILAGFLVLAGGCGGGGGMTVDEFYADQVEVQCQFLVSCCQGMEDGKVYATVAECVAADSDPTNVALVKSQIAAGLLAFDASKATSCISKQKAIYGTCTNTIDATDGIAADAPCEDAVHGTLKAGATCTLTAAPDPCGSGLECASQTSETSACTPLATSGESCASVDCTGTLFCNDSSVCQAQLTAGAACSSDGACASFVCGDDGTCGASAPVAIVAGCPK